MNRHSWSVGILLLVCLVAPVGLLSPDGPGGRGGPNPFDRTIDRNAAALLAEGRQTFRFDTFGSEDFWGGQLQLHQAVARLTPRDALGLGLKVDVDALPPGVVQRLKQGKVNLDDPATTLALLQRNAVVGVTGFFRGGTLRSIGIQCALCHSTVDDSLAAGVGRRLDGWANRDLNVGAIVLAAPRGKEVFAGILGVSEDTVETVLSKWGPGKFDAELILDGKGLRPDGGSAATLIPPAFGLAGVNLHTWTGWGSVPHWNAFVANLEMQGKGNFFDPRLKDAAKFPIASARGFDNVRTELKDDRITPKLAALHFYQLAIPAPEPPRGLFDPARARRGAVLFTGKAQCATCHIPPLYTEPGWNLHTPEEIGIDDFQASRSPDGRYRTAPLKGLWTHTKGGFYHDGRFPTLLDVVEHYNQTLIPVGDRLNDEEKEDLVEFLKSI